MDAFDTAVVDALPYVDRIDEATRAEVELLISEEMKQMPKPSRANSDSASSPLFPEETLRAKEWARLGRGETMPSLDLTRYKMEAPESESLDQLEAWIEAMNNAKAQLEHQQSRFENLELLSKFGNNAWQVHNQQLESMLKQIQSQTEALREQIAQVNKQRKSDQKAAGAKLRQLDDEWVALLNQSLQVEAACLQLQQSESPSGASNA